MQIRIDVPLGAQFSLFDSGTVSTGMTAEAPGGVTIRLGPPPIEHRGISNALPYVPILVSGLSGIGINLFSSWLYQKLMQRRSGPPNMKIRIEHRETEISPDGIRRTIEEFLEVDQRK